MSWITDLMKELPVSAIQKEHLELIKTKANQLESELAKLRQENEALSKENASLKAELASLKTPTGFIEREGILWRKESDGTYRPYCPKCRLVMAKFPPWSPDTLRCSQCKFIAPFHPNQTEEIAAGITSST